jgi:excisionase family DNA binding protein
MLHSAPLPAASCPPGRRPSMMEMAIAMSRDVEAHLSARARRVVPLRTAMPMLPLPVRRFLSIDEAASYVGVSVDTFRQEVADGRWPQPVRRGRTGRAVTWDVRALDAAADLMAGIAYPVVPLVAAEGGVSSTKVALMARFKA